MKKILSIILSLSLTLSLGACGTGGNGGSSSSNGSSDTSASSSASTKNSATSSSSKTGSSAEKLQKIKVGATPVPHAEILELIKPQLEEAGYNLEIVEFTDYPLINAALDEGNLDANFFQHKPYLETQIKEKGYKLVSACSVHIEPIGVYSKKIKNLDELKNGDKVAVPNDESNEARALKLLQDNGVIKLKDVENPTLLDITENSKKLEFIEADAAQLPRSLDDVACAIINSNYALEANLSPAKDAIAIESKDSPYVNILVVREEDQNKDFVKALKNALNSDEVKKYIEDNSDKTGIVPAF